jgi:spermidine synthase
LRVPDLLPKATKMKSALQKSFQRQMSAFEELYLASKGKPFAFDSEDMRTLHFDARFIQSAMRISAPDELLLSYTRAMMAFLLFNRQPKTMLMIGLGGGSLAKYCHRILPNTKITVLEVDADVIALRDTFVVPAESERFTVVHTDAKNYIAAIDQQMDIIVHDGFDVDGLVPALSTTAFYTACYEALSDNGILVSNLWGDAENLAPVMDRLWSVFDRRLWWSGAAASLNRIVCAVKSSQDVALSVLRTQAVLLDLIYDLAFEALVERFQTGQGKTKVEFEAISGINLFAALMLVDSDEAKKS